ncbi:MAG: shikimate dehydrogenase [Deltaproteobacteria bacterium RIFCSPLOWO2_02_FULL_50_16]|nr:MAG: shikimate dehydrogenase [Deltaproteobacteria bacterium RIFCSPLOWO2_02_FULL_50_16]OGQ66943.1 MAG: shikimate dehydrogenase [Deltaproteobacteria bacterium RIFCSPLOWO2_12_FULL_50_11]
MVKFVGVIGDPIHHSLSPSMHNAVFKKYKMDYLYLPFHVTPRQLSDFVKHANLWDLKGFNITIPHKKSIMRYCHQLSCEAKLIGAVNTVVIRSGQWKGHNTDYEGFLTALKKSHCHPQNKNVVLIGAGGAAHAVLYGLCLQKARSVIVVDLYKKTAQGLVRHFQKKFPKTSLRALSWKEVDLKKILGETFLLVNASPIGLNGTSFKNLPLSHMPPKSFVYDLVYTPLVTPLLRQARRHGLKTIPGIDMFIHQGARAFYLWTRRRPDVRLMKSTILKYLKKA